ncbi:MAG: metal-dependent hydrolase [Balneolaceae bacterium]|nr:MAG: metal-dependent hydrolase [Balneolaceae bacterium]
MDSLTQITLGAAVGELVLGRKVGNKAMLWGAVAGTIPDLDVVFGLFMDPVSYLSVHRGFSHSVFFPFIAAPILAWIITRIHGTGEASFRGWTHLAFWSLLTHPLLDLFTGYGTQLFNPISNYGFELNTIFIIDPLYTLPFLVCTITAMFYHRTSDRRRFWAYLGIGLSTGYLILTVFIKLYIHNVFKTQLDRQEIAYEELMTFPAPLQTIFWRGLAKTEDGFYEGYFSLFDRDAIEFTYIPSNAGKLDPYLDDEPVKQLLWFSKGFFQVHEEQDAILFHDLRFGSLFGWRGDFDSHVFTFHLKKENGQMVTFYRDVNGADIDRRDLNEYFRRVFGVLPPDEDLADYSANVNTGF